jgi:ribonucleoside-diphosphate reductase alpha chain
MSTKKKEIAAKLKPPALAPQPITTDVLQGKYCKGDERTQHDVRSRVAVALALAELPDKRAFYREQFTQAQEDGAILAGRINSAAGTGLASTLINCFVQPVGDWIRGFENAIPGIFEANNQAAETMARGGGVGYDFSAIRPKGAVVKGKASIASGPISYMHVFDQMCKTVSSAGNRRGAQMGVLRIDHPDIEEFINEKSNPGLLTQFNVSVAVTDEFLAALESGQPFDLVHSAEPSADDDRAKQRDDGLWVYNTIDPQTLWDQIMELTYDYAEPGILFVDNANRDNNLWYCETFAATNPCAEQWLPPYGCCCLGSLDLTKFVVNPFVGSAVFDFEKFSERVATTVRMLDNVLDVTYWPLDEQRDEAMNKRRIGLGFTGLGDSLLMCNLRYDSEEGRAFASSISEAMRDAAYSSSVELAKEKGAFPLFDAEKYLESEFSKRLPEDIRSDIRTHGIRNSHLLSIAPTGTISLAFADNASNGIEPAFSWFYTRRKLEADGSHTEFSVVDHAFRLFHRMTSQVDACDCNEDQLKQLAADLPDHWVNALQISASDHLKMVATVQPYIDSSISKTVNVPSDYPFEEFKDLYSEAASAGLKGLATYRPSEVRGAVLSVESSDKADSKAPELTLDQSDIDRRLTIDRLPEPVLQSLRWPKRPKLPNGNPARTYMVKTEEHSFAVFVGHTQNGTNHPFEVWVNGSEQPRGLGAIAKALSMDMRSADRSFLKAKLDSLERAVGDDGFDLELPPEGKVVRVPSLVSGFAKLVKHCVSELEDNPPTVPEGEMGPTDLMGHSMTPMMDALMSPKEPKTDADGTMSWSVDVRNHATGDDFVLFVKELVMPNGQRRPFSIWMSGQYPRVFDGLCKVLSYDMRIVDPAWIGAKLRSLFDFAEPRGDFLASVPGSEKKANYPSTVAYIARLLAHRYAMLGILDDDVYPVEDIGMMGPEYKSVVRLNANKSSTSMKGTLCGECNTYSVIKRDGCKFCTHCGAEGDCG